MNCIWTNVLSSRERGRERERGRTSGLSQSVRGFLFLFLLILFHVMGLVLQWRNVPEKKKNALLLLLSLWNCLNANSENGQTWPEVLHHCRCTLYTHTTGQGRSAAHTVTVRGQKDDDAVFVPMLICLTMTQLLYKSLGPYGHIRHVRSMFAKGNRNDRAVGECR